VRDLEDVDRVHTGGEQVGLGLGLDVAREQHREPRGPDVQDERAVVGVAAGAAVATTGRDDGPRQVTEGAGLPQCRGADRHTRLARPAQDPRVLLLRLAERADLEQAHRP
jgi:hypothetical protein